MISYKQYYQVIDELRQANNISVSDLCEGIISERTYFRNLHSNDNIKFSVVLKLLDRLNISLAQFVTYAVHLRGEDKGVNKFIYRVHTQNFLDIDQYYKSVTSEPLSNSMFDLAIQTYINKYKYLKGKLSKDEYILELEKILGLFDKSSPIGLYKIVVYSLLMEIGRMPEEKLLNEIVETFINLDLSLSFLLYLITADVLLYTLIDKDLINENIKRKLVEKFNIAISFFPNKLFFLKKHFYTAYINRLDNNIEQMNKNLFLSSISLAILLGGSQYTHAIGKIESIFNIDYLIFLKEQTLNELKTRKFKIID